MHNVKPATVEDHNFYHLVWDVAWFGVAWVTITRFLSVYAIRVGASPTELGWITAGPFIGMTLASALSVWWRNRHRDSVRAVLLPSVLFRFNFLLLALTPLFPLQWQPLWLIVAVTLPSLPQGLSNVMFLNVLKETTSEQRMAHLLGRRTLIVNATLGLGALIFGVWLERVPFPYNYALMFAFAFVAAMFSHYHLHHLHPLNPDEVKPEPATNREQVRPLANPAFRSVLLVAVAGHVAFFSVFPIITLRLVNELGASEGYMAIFSVVELTAGAMLAAFMGRIVRRFGNRKMVGGALMITSLAALTVAFTPSLPLALFAAGFTGMGWALSEIGMIAYMTEIIPTRNASHYSRMFSQVSWSAVFIAPFIGTNLAELGVSLPAILVLGAVLRFGAGWIALSGIPFTRRRQAQLQKTW